MLFFVHGHDRAGVGERLEALSEAHWAYLDDYAEQLVARGPTLSPDGMAHTGSIHVVDLADRAAAQRFADEEPFNRAGLYDEVSVTRFDSALDSTMFDRAYAGGAGGSSLVLARWPGSANGRDSHAALGPAAAEPAAGHWAFLGLLLTDDASSSLGLAGAVDLAPADAAAAGARLLESVGRSAADLSSQRWQRGGRPG